MQFSYYEKELILCFALIKHQAFSFYKHTELKLYYNAKNMLFLQPIESLHLQTKKIPEGPNIPSVAISTTVPMSTAVITTA